MASRAGDTASFVSKESTSPAVMFTSRLILPIARTNTHWHASCCLLLLWCCCCTAVGFGAATTTYSWLQPCPLSSLVTKKRNKKECHKRQRKQRTPGGFPNKQLSRR